MTVSEDLLQRVWEKGDAAHFNPEILRKDQCGAWISRIRHGDRNSIYGWEIDHINPDGMTFQIYVRCNGKTVLTKRQDG
jgi:hypothetical protein